MQVVELRNKGYTLRQIGSKIGISHEWARQILLKETGTTRISILKQVDVEKLL